MSTIEIKPIAHPPVEIDGALLCGPREGAEMFGVRPQTFLSWHTVRKVLPKATFISGNPVWPHRVLEEWGIKTGRLVYTEFTE
jgi:hypothetical protein